MNVIGLWEGSQGCVWRASPLGGGPAGGWLGGLVGEWRVWEEGMWGRGGGGEGGREGGRERDRGMEGFMSVEGRRNGERERERERERRKERSYKSLEAVLKKVRTHGLMACMAALQLPTGRERGEERKEEAAKVDRWLLCGVPQPATVPSLLDPTLHHLALAGEGGLGGKNRRRAPLCWQLWRPV